MFLVGGFGGVEGELTGFLVYGESKLGGDEIVEYAKVRFAGCQFPLRRTANGFMDREC